jgi:UDP-glucose 4-epimerase
MTERILVTGGCGFIGANLVPQLLADGNAVRVLDDLRTGRAEYLDGYDVELVEGDICDAALVAETMDGVSAVIHLAAAGSVVDSVADPAANFAANAAGTFTVLDAVRVAGIDRLVFSSTGGALIGNATPPVNERSLPKPISPYGASKLAAEAYCHAFAMSYGIRTVATRFANVYGPFSGHKKGAITAFFKAIHHDLRQRQRVARLHVRRRHLRRHPSRADRRRRRRHRRPPGDGCRDTGRRACQGVPGGSRPPGAPDRVPTSARR